MTNEAIEFMAKNNVLYLATVDSKGNPRVRPFMYYFEKNGKPYFCTSNKKPMYEQLKAHPQVEFTTANPEFAWIRFNGKVVFTSDISIKNAIIEASPLVKSLYGSGSNPDFEAFTIEGTAVIADFSGQPPKTYTI